MWGLLIGCFKVKEGYEHEENQPQLGGSFQINDPRVLHIAVVLISMYSALETGTSYHFLQEVIPQGCAHYITEILYDVALSHSGVQDKTIHEHYQFLYQRQKFHKEHSTMS